MSEPTFPTYTPAPEGVPTPPAVTESTSALSVDGIEDELNRLADIAAAPEGTYIRPTEESTAAAEPAVVETEQESKVEMVSAEQLAKQVLEEIAKEKQDAQVPSISRAFTRLAELEGLSPELQIEVEDLVFEHFGITREQVDYAKSALENNREFYWIAIPSNEGVIRVGYGSITSKNVGIIISGSSLEETERMIISTWQQTPNHHQIGAILEGEDGNFALREIEGKNGWPSREQDPDIFQRKLDQAEQDIMDGLDDKLSPGVHLSHSIEAYPAEVRSELYAQIVTKLLGADWQNRISRAEEEIEAELNSNLPIAKQRLRGQNKVTTTIPGVSFILMKNTSDTATHLPYIQQVKREKQG